MKNTIITFLLTLVLIACGDRNKNYEYDLDDKGAFFFENENIINPKARDLFNNGIQEIRKNNPLKAKTLLEKANDIEKNNPTILNSLGNYEIFYGDKSLSYKIFYKVLEIDSSFVPTYINLGYNYMKDRKYEEASETLKEGIKYLPENNEHQKSILYLNLAITLNNLNDCKGGLDYGEKALQYSQNSDFTELSKKIIKESRALCEKK